jgi:anti-anti-sigma factor
MDDTVLVIALEGAVTLSTLPQLSDGLSRAVGTNFPSGVVVDLDALDTVDDAGLGILMGFVGKLRLQGLDAVCIASLPRIRQRLADTGFDKAVAVAGSQTEAVRRLG